MDPNSMDINDVSMSLDMVEMGVKPLNWFDETKQFGFDDVTHVKEYIVYPVEIPSIQFSTKTSEQFQKRSSSDDEDEAEFDIDPETGEKVFRQSNSTLIVPSNESDDNWVEEYLSNLEASSNQLLPQPVPTDPNDSLFNEIPDPLFPTVDSNWISELINSQDNSSIFVDEESSSNFSNFVSLQTENDSLNTERTFEFEDSPSSNRTRTRSLYQIQQDEERLIQHQIPLTVNEITQSSTEEYNQILAKLTHLSSEQIHIVKDIRRRGKNKIAAQNCRKRKAVSVETLMEEVDELKRLKNELEARKKTFEEQILEKRRQYEYLHRQILPNHQLPPAIVVK